MRDEMKPAMVAVREHRFVDSNAVSPVAKARVEEALGTANEALGRLWDRVQRLECRLQSVMRPEPPATPSQTSAPQPAADRIFDIAASVDRCAACLEMLGSRLEV